MKDDNVRANINDLRRIGALIQETPPGPDGARYLVRGMDTLLDYWRRSNATHVLKNRKAVQIVDSSGKPVFTAGVPNVGVSKAAVRSNSGVPRLDSPVMQSRGTQTGGSYKEKESIVERTTSAASVFSAEPELVEALNKATGKSDDDAVRQILEGCRAVAPDVTTEELVQLIDDQAARIPASISNPTGFLIRFLPKRCEGHSFQTFREGLRRRREVEQEAAATKARENREFAQRLLNDPAADEADKAWAREVLREGNC